MGKESFVVVVFQPWCWNNNVHNEEMRLDAYFKNTQNVISDYLSAKVKTIKLLEENTKYIHDLT